MRIHLHKTCSLLFIAAFFLTCREQSAPDVSTIPVTFSIQRFEKDFFSIDTLQVDRSLDRLNEKYPDFLPPFITQVLGLNPQKDSLTFNENLIRFIRDYKPIFDSCEHRFGDMETVEKEIREGLQRVLYYFPQYRTPGSLITFIGPMDAIFTASLSSYSDIITEHALGSGLQLHLGAGFSFYHSPMGQALYPDYISRRFTPETIVVNALKNIIDDMYPEQKEDNVLVDQMVEKGKRLYLLDQFLPNMPDTIKIGYTYSQWKGCIENEGKIWNYFVTNNLLMSNDPLVLQRFLDEGPQTPELGEGSPGYIGLFTGKRIVETYMQKNDSISLEQLLKTPARTIFQESKYRPK